jgi:hypothetical protein
MQSHIGVLRVPRIVAPTFRAIAQNVVYNMELDGGWGTTVMI